MQLFCSFAEKDCYSVYNRNVIYIVPLSKGCHRWGVTLLPPVTFTHGFFYFLSGKLTLPCAVLLQPIFPASHHVVNAIFLLVQWTMSKPNNNKPYSTTPLPVNFIFLNHFLTAWGKVSDGLHFNSSGKMQDLWEVELSISMRAFHVL